MTFTKVHVGSCPPDELRSHHLRHAPAIPDNIRSVQPGGGLLQRRTSVGALARAYLKRFRPGFVRADGGAAQGDAAAALTTFSIRAI